MFKCKYGARVSKRKIKMLKNRIFSASLAFHGRIGRYFYVYFPYKRISFR